MAVRLVKAVLIAIIWLLGLPLAVVVALAVAGRSSSGSIDSADWVGPSKVDVVLGGALFVLVIVGLVSITAHLVRWHHRPGHR